MGDKRSRLQPRFDAIEKAGGIKLPNMKRGSGVSFTAMERHKATFSVWAFLFTIVYYGYHGVWKKGLSLLVIGIVAQLSLDIILEMTAGIAAPPIVASVLFAMSAPRNLYSKYVLNENGWNPF
tara:strand:- start:133 stop:501 length:369 start_codon:yes stop_codon:yes gene_type:complete